MLPALEISAVGELTESLPSQEEPGAMKQCRHLLSKTKEQQQNQASKQTKTKTKKTKKHKKQKNQNKKTKQTNKKKETKYKKGNRKKAKKGEGRFQLKFVRNRSCKLAQD